MRPVPLCSAPPSEKTHRLSPLFPSLGESFGPEKQFLAKSVSGPTYCISDTNDSAGWAKNWPLTTVLTKLLCLSPAPPCLSASSLVF